MMQNEGAFLSQNAEEANAGKCRIVKSTFFRMVWLQLSALRLDFGWWLSSTNYLGLNFLGVLIVF